MWKIQVFVTPKSGQDARPDPHWFGSPDPDPHWVKKLDRIRIETYENPQHCVRHNKAITLMRYQLKRRENENGRKLLTVKNESVEDGQEWGVPHRSQVFRYKFWK